MPTDEGDVIVVEVKSKITGLTKKEFVDIIPRFEADMALYYNVTEVLVTRVSETSVRRRFHLRRLGEGGGAELEIEYVVVVEDGKEAAGGVVEAAASNATADVVKSSVEVASLEVLNKVVVVEVESLGLTFVTLSANEMEETKLSNNVLAGKIDIVDGGEDEVEGLDVALVGSFVAMTLIIVAIYMFDRRRKENLRLNQVHIARIEEEAREKELAKAEAERKKKEEEAENERKQKMAEREAELKLEMLKLQELERIRKEKEASYKLKQEEEQLAKAEAEGKQKTEAEVNEFVGKISGPPIIQFTPEQIKQQRVKSEERKMHAKEMKQKEADNLPPITHDWVHDHAEAYVEVDSKKKPQLSASSLPITKGTPDESKSEDLVAWLRDKDILDEAESEDDNAESLLDLAKMDLDRMMKRESGKSPSKETGESKLGHPHHHHRHHDEKVEKKMDDGPKPHWH